MRKDIRENVREFAIGDRVDSDHMPLLNMEGEEERQKSKKKKQGIKENCMEPDHNKISRKDRNLSW